MDLETGVKLAWVKQAGEGAAQVGCPLARSGSDQKLICRVA